MSTLAQFLAPLVLAAVATPAWAQNKPASKPANPPAQKPGTGDKKGPKDNPKDAPKQEPRVDTKKDGNKGLINVDGEWYTKEEKEKLDKGWKKLDYEWIAPEEAGNIEKGMFKINGSWVTQDQADTYHANEETPWIIPTKHFAITSNITRKQILMLAEFGEKTYTGLKEMFGVEPKGRLGVRVFNSVDAANNYGQQFAGGDRASNHSAVWLAYLSEGEKERPAVLLFDGEPGKGFSHLHMMHATVHKYLDTAFPDGDAIPEWFNEGLATYFERYTDGSLRQWALQQIVKRGGVEKLGSVTKKFALSADDAYGSQTKMQLAGLIVAYYVLSPDKPDEALFKKVLAAMPKAKEVREAAIEQLVANPEVLEKKLKKFAGL